MLKPGCILVMRLRYVRFTIFEPSVELHILKISGHLLD
ncbi:hypothetical protein RK21_02078 [Pseudomonas plecoglossicida]|nr:hypothetical protein RK21_02078 [Pseudomonas plecoglossicida]